MDRNRAIEVLDYMESECVKRGARKDVEREAIQAAKAALKAQAQSETVSRINEYLGPAPNKPAQAPDGIQPFLKNAFITCETSGFDKRYVVVLKFPTLEGAQDLHRYLVTLPAAPAISKTETVGWQPIETAPKSTKSILVHCAERGNSYVVTWREDLEESGWLHFGGCFYRLTETPTHWMPLPAAPAPAGGE